jgi:hypothetical protein
MIGGVGGEVYADGFACCSCFFNSACWAGVIAAISRRRWPTWRNSCRSYCSSCSVKGGKGLKVVGFGFAEGAGFFALDVLLREPFTGNSSVEFGFTDKFGLGVIAICAEDLVAAGVVMAPIFPPLLRSAEVVAGTCRGCGRTGAAFAEDRIAEGVPLDYR